MTHGACNHEIKRLENELIRLRAEVEILVWNLAGISTMACRRTPIDYNQDRARPALNEVAELVKDYSRLRAVNAELVKALRSLRPIVEAIHTALATTPTDIETQCLYDEADGLVDAIDAALSIAE